MKKFAFKSIRSKLTFWFVILGLAPLLIGILITYHQQIRSIEEETFDKLITIRDLKVQALEDWIDEKESWMKSVSEDKEFRELEQFFQKKVFDKPDYRIIKNMRRILKRHLINFDDFFELLIINRYSGKVIVSTNSDNEGMDESQDPSLTEFLAIEDCYIKDIHLSRFYHVPAMAFAIPIRCIQHNGKHVIGILVARVNLGESLFAFLLNRTGLGKTGETLIVNKDVVALNELIWHENAPLDLQIQAEPAVNAVRGKTGIIETADYRGENVLAAYTYIPRTGWGFVAKQDMAELYAPIKSMTVNFISLICGTILSVVILVFFLARSSARPIVEMAATADKIQKGDFSARNHVTGVDETAVLAETFNILADFIESQLELREMNDEITQTLVDAKDLPAFRTNILKKIVKVTGSQMGVYFVLNSDTNIFEPFTSIGVTPGILKPFDAPTLEGELGMVVETEKIAHIKDIPEDSIFRFRTFTGTILPKEIISIPVIIDGVVSGIVSLASIKPYPLKVFDIMEQPWRRGFGTALSNMQANAETARLAAELKETNQELAAQSEELESQAEELQQTADELQEQNVELELQGKQVEEANRLKSEFLSNMSHELRTPLNSVMALSRVLIRQAKDKLSEEELNYLKIIARNGKSLLALINDILDLAKIEAGNMDVNLKLFSLDSAVETIMERLEPLAEEKDIEMHLKIPDDLPKIESDEVRVHQILQNIIGNAVKFTAKGSVTASGRSDGENIHIEVTDTGIGIANKDLPYIFEEFRQVDGSSARAYEGTGLGLTIAYRAARVLGGELRVQSVLGKGSKFTLTLPIKWPDIMPEPRPVAPMPPVEIEQPRKTVLVVDDAPDVAAMIADYLIREGYDALTTTSGKQALELAEKHQPFAITLDIVMPDMDGFAVLEMIRSDPATRNLPVIVVTAKDLTAEDREKLTGKVSSILAKSDTTSTALLEEIKKILGNIEKFHKYPESRKLKAVNRILLVEDNEAAMIQVKTVLESEGYGVDVAQGGKQALEYIKDTIPNGIILDLMMPEVDGFEVLQSIRSHEATAHIPILILTAKDLTQEDLKKIKNNNIKQLIQKGDVAREDLLVKVKSMLGEKTHAAIETPVPKSKIQQPEPARERKTAGISTILVVEDNPDNMVSIKAVLQNKYTLLEATDGEEGLKKALTKGPDLILLDMSLPGMDGFTVAGKLKEEEKTRHIPIIAVTARAMKGDRETILEAGCDDYMSKPIDSEIVLKKIEDWIRKLS